MMNTMIFTVDRFLNNFCFAFMFRLKIITGFVDFCFRSYIVYLIDEFPIMKIQRF